MYIICQNNQQFSYFCVILFICKMRAEGIGKFLFVKIINSLADIQIKFTHVYLSALTNVLGIFFDFRESNPCWAL